MTTSKTSESTAKKDVAKLQRAIVDGLEDVKAQDIQVFNTEHLSPLFERVIVASGTSNRQTKALAASVRDAVKEAGPKPRTEGEENGEWIIVDCGAAVAHIMQPTIRQYYRLEDLWGEMPVRLKLGAAKPVAPEAKVPVKTAARRAAKAAAATEAAATAKKAAPRKGARSHRRPLPRHRPAKPLRDPLRRPGLLPRHRRRQLRSSCQRLLRKWL
jgi:ribosome-associated protein